MGRAERKRRERLAYERRRAKDNRVREAARRLGAPVTWQVEMQQPIEMISVTYTVGADGKLVELHDVRDIEYRED